MSRKQYFDIKYPFTNVYSEKYEFDLNQNKKSSVESDILHVIFTPKRQRLRNPEFGTDLIKYIFEPSDEMTWGGVKKEIQESVSRWVSGAIINDINVLANDDGTEIYVRIDYSVRNGNSLNNNSVVIQI